MGRRTNYGFEKRQRELKKQKKKEAKAERKRLKKEEEAGTVGEGAVDGEFGEESDEEIGDEEEEDELV